MESRKDLAVSKWKSGYNCAQAVACTYADLINQDEKMLFMATEALGSGLSGLKRTCGALLGATIVLGFINSDGNTSKPTTKHKTYEIGNKMITDFENVYKTSICKNLKFNENGKIVPCNKCIETACLILEDIISNQDK